MYLKLKNKLNKEDLKNKKLFLNCPYNFKNKDVNIVFNCINCKDPKCLYACKKGAIYYSSEETLSIDQSKCDGCGECAKACPYDAILIRNKEAYKCDLCANQSFAMHCYSNNKDVLELIDNIDDKDKQNIYEKYLGYKLVEVDIEEKLSNSNSEIVKDRNNKKRYIINEVILSLEEIKIINLILDRYKHNSISEDENKLSIKVRKELEKELVDYCYEENIELDDDQFNYLLDISFNNLYNYGPITELLKDPELEEISIIGKDKPVYVYHKLFGWLETNLIYVSTQILKDLINKLSWYSNKYITLKNPVLNTSLKDNSRLNAVINPIVDSAALTIRKFSEKPFTVKDLLDLNTISLDALAFLSLVFLTDSNVFVVGNTGSGKTTTLNTLLSFVPYFERFVVVEEVREINIPHPHKVFTVVNLDLGITMENLVINTLRMRPDRVVIGEVRSKEESKAVIDSMLCGQAKGTYCTFHSQTANEAILRLESYGIMACDLGVLDLIITQRRYNKYGKGKVTDLRNIIEISEVSYEDNKIKLNKLYEFNIEKNKLIKKNPPRKILQKLKTSFGIKSNTEYNKLISRQKTKLKKLLNKKNIDTKEYSLLFEDK